MKHVRECCEVNFSLIMSSSNDEENREEGPPIILIRGDATTLCRIRGVDEQHTRSDRTK